EHALNAAEPPAVRVDDRTVSIDQRENCGPVRMRGSILRGRRAGESQRARGDGTAYSRRAVRFDRNWPVRRAAGAAVAATVGRGEVQTANRPRAHQNLRTSEPQNLRTPEPQNPSNIRNQHIID